MENEALAEVVFWKSKLPEDKKLDCQWTVQEVSSSIVDSETRIQIAASSREDCALRCIKYPYAISAAFPVFDSCECGFYAQQQLEYPQTANFTLLTTCNSSDMSQLQILYRASFCFIFSQVSVPEAR